MRQYYPNELSVLWTLHESLPLFIQTTTLGISSFTSQRQATLTLANKFAGPSAPTASAPLMEPVRTMGLKYSF